PQENSTPAEHNCRARSNHTELAIEALSATCCSLSAKGASRSSISRRIDRRPLMPKVMAKTISISAFIRRGDITESLMPQLFPQMLPTQGCLRFLRALRQDECPHHQPGC